MSRHKRSEPTSPATPPRRALFLVAAVCAMAIVAGIVRWRARPSEGAGASVLLVTIDTLRADHVGAYGAKTGATPHLDALAARGTVFEEALASVPLTLPSHASILSGREPPHHGVHLNGRAIFPADAPTLATLLKGRGYATAGFVAAYVLDRRFGLARGFDLYDDQVERRSTGTSVLESERPCTEVAAAAEQWIGRQPGPFFAWVHFYEPHAPYDPPSPYREQQGGRPYDGEIAAADGCLGRVIAAAEARAPGLVVAATGDHGEALGDHGELTHGFFVYQSTLRVPLILAGPGVPVARRTAPARAVDLVPTILARVAVAAPAGLDGADLLGPARGAEAYAETQYPETLGWAGLRALRLGALKYIDAPRPELYDLGADPGETRNLVTTRAADAQRLKRGLDALRATERAAIATADDPEIAEKLRALGYVAAPAAATTNGPRLDPKDALETWRRFEDAIWADARGEHTAAAEALHSLVGREPDNPALRQALAAALRAAGRPAEAAEAMGSLETIAPSDPLAWHERSIALDAAGQLAEAMRSERRAIALDPSLPEPHNHLGSLLARGGQHGEALAEFTRATVLDPNNSGAWTNRANALRGMGQPREAAEAYRTASGLAPRDPGPRNGLGVLSVESGDLDRAVALFEEALAIDPHYHEARLNLAVAEVRRGHPAAARAALQALLQAQPDRETAAKAAAFLRDLGGS